MQTQTHTTRLHSEEHVDREFRAAVTGAQIVAGACIIWVEIGHKMVPEVVAKYRFDDRERETDVQRRKGVPQSGDSVEVKAAKGVVP